MRGADGFAKIRRPRFAKSLAAPNKTKRTSLARKAGPFVPEFDALYADFVKQVNPLAQNAVAHQLDKFVYDHARALFLCAPHALYAVNKHVDFTAYRTTFELAECKVSEQHWSRRQ